MIRQLLKRGRMTTTPDWVPLAPVLLPGRHHTGPMPMYLRLWHWTAAGLVAAGLAEGEARVRLDYQPAPPGHPAPAPVSIAGPAAAHPALEELWQAAHRTPVAIELWSQHSLGARPNAMHTVPVHVYALLPLLTAAEPPTPPGPRSRPARHWTAEPGNRWGRGPLPVLHNGDGYRDHLPQRVPATHMWHLTTTTLTPAAALGLDPDRRPYRGHQ